MMKSFHCADLIFCSLLLLAISAYSKAEMEQTKNRRAGGTSGLYAFPRVGRSDPSLTLGNVHNSEAENAAAAAFDALYAGSFEEYEEYPKSDLKRASLFNAPRVGRMDPEVRKWARFLAMQQSLDKRAGPSATTGVWFGPRLGKRSVDAQNVDSSKGQKEEY
ncbi:cardio acceleratory peptide capability [Musca autumnalis]|uniref:cardio acceleratory peptide capability n=1 Tax=Musca autumnalis TaxID=221902 RepID=UPI003CED9CE5